MKRNPAVWTLEELVAQVAIALSTGDYEGAVNGRVRDVPDARAVRYYTTLGLLDRPAGWNGRTALYGERHLQQIVAIKKLQARGHSLARVQQVLAGIDERALARIAALSQSGAAEAGIEAKRELASDVADETRTIEPAPAKATSRRRGAFWAPEPAPAPKAAPPTVAAGAGTSFDALGGERESDLAAAAATRAAGMDAPRGNLAARKASEPASPNPMAGLRLGERAVLLLDAARPPDNADLEAIAAAAAPLLKVLESRGLLPKPSHEDEEEKGEKR